MKKEERKKNMKIVEAIQSLHVIIDLMAKKGGRM